MNHSPLESMLALCVEGAIVVGINLITAVIWCVLPRELEVLEEDTLAVEAGTTPMNVY